MTETSLDTAALTFYTAQLMRHVAEAKSFELALAEVESFGRRCFPADVRLDVLDEVEDRHICLYAGTPGDAPHQHPSMKGFVDWLSQRGYQAISTIPLTAFDTRRGWLIIARVLDRLDSEYLGIAGQLAGILALRLFGEHANRHLAQANATIARLERRQSSNDEVRLWATLAAGAAHDIGNLFASVLGHVQLLQQGSETPGADLQVIEQAARDGNILLQRILVSHLHSEEATPNLTLLPQAVHDALQLTRPMWQARSLIQIETRFEPVAPVRIRPAEIREVLINLILNGIAAMPEGGTLTLSVQQASSCAQVVVSDSGIGMSESFQHALFQPAITARPGGNGLGLSISRQIVEAAGGSIDIASKPGEGSRFTISLPLTLAD